MSKHNTADEVSVDELGGVFRKLYYFFLTRFYRIFRFFIKSWIIVLALIIIGGIIGYFQMKDKSYPKKAELLVQINYGSANHIYQAVELLSKKVHERDTAFFKENDLFRTSNLGIKKIEIEPVINLNEILRGIPDYSRPFEILVDESKTKETLLASELFRNQYRIHRLTIKTSETGSQNTIKAVIDFLNQDPAFKNTKEVYIKNLDFQVHETKFSISRIDSIFNKLGNLSFSKKLDNQVYVNTQENNVNELHLLLEEKARLLEHLQQLEIDQMNYENPVVLKSQATLIPDKGFFSNRMIWMPVLLVFIFTTLSAFWYFLKKGKKLTSENH